MQQNTTHTARKYHKYFFALSPQIPHEAATRSNPLGEVLYLSTLAGREDAYLPSSCQEPCWDTMHGHFPEGSLTPHPGQQ